MHQKYISRQSFYCYFLFLLLQCIYVSKYTNNASLGGHNLVAMPTMAHIHIQMWMLTWWIPVNFEKRSGGMHQSNTFRFSLILVSFTLFGRTLCPLWIPQRRATCAGDLFSFSAISTMIDSFNISPFTQDPGDPRGEYPCKSFHSIWFETKLSA